MSDQHNFKSGINTAKEALFQTIKKSKGITDGGIAHHLASDKGSLSLYKSIVPVLTRILEKERRIEKSEYSDSKNQGWNAVEK